MKNKNLKLKMDSIDKKISELKDLKAKLRKECKTHTLYLYDTGDVYACSDCGEVWDVSSFGRGGVSQLESEKCPGLIDLGFEECHFCGNMSDLYCLADEICSDQHMYFLCIPCSEVEKNVYGDYPSRLDVYKFCWLLLKKGEIELAFKIKDLNDRRCLGETFLDAVFGDEIKSMFYNNRIEAIKFKSIMKSLKLTPLQKKVTDKIYGSIEV